MTSKKKEKKEVSLILQLQKLIKHRFMKICCNSLILLLSQCRSLGRHTLPTSCSPFSPFRGCRIAERVNHSWRQLLSTYAVSDKVEDMKSCYSLSPPSLHVLDWEGQMTWPVSLLRSCLTFTGKLSKLRRAVGSKGFCCAVTSWLCGTSAASLKICFSSSKEQVRPNRKFQKSISQLWLTRSDDCVKISSWLAKPVVWCSSWSDLIAHQAFRFHSRTSLMQFS